mgnify:FL=1
MVTTTISKETAKNMASRLREFLREGGHEMKQTHAYEAIAKMLGYRNWNTLTTVLEEKPAGELLPDRTADEIEIYWPWVGLARSRERHASGDLVHQPLTWQAAQAGKPIVYHFELPTMMMEPQSFGLSITGTPNEVSGEALLAIFIEAVANLIEAYAAKRMEGVSAGHEVSRNIWHTRIQYHVPGAKTFELAIRARGGRDQAESKILLVQAAGQAARDLHAWAQPILDRYRQTGRPWSDLEQYGDWVGYVLRSARLSTPHLT